MDYQDFNELYHHGVKGMKWGHHKPQEPTSTNNSRNKSNKNIGFINSVNKSVAKFEMGVENKLKKMPIVGKHARNMKEVSESEHAKRGYALIGGLLAASTVAIIGNSIHAKSTKASSVSKSTKVDLSTAFNTKNQKRVANGKSAATAIIGVVKAK